MNQAHNLTTKITLAEALAADDPAGESEWLPMSEFAFTDEERKRTSELWLHLVGIKPGSKAEAVAGIEVLTNPDLFIMLNAPAREFVNWLRVADWQAFDLTGATGSDEWACVALERARAMSRAMGKIGSQEPLRLPSVV